MSAGRCDIISTHHQPSSKVSRAGRLLAARQQQRKKTSDRGSEVNVYKNLALLGGVGTVGEGTPAEDKNWQTQVLLLCDNEKL